MHTDFVSKLLAELETAVLPIFGILLDKEPPSSGMELWVDLHYRPAHGQQPRPKADILDAQFG